MWYSYNNHISAQMSRKYHFRLVGVLQLWVPEFPCPCIYESSLSPIPDEDRAVLGHTNNCFELFCFVFHPVTALFWDYKSQSQKKMKPNEWSAHGSCLWQVHIQTVMFFVPLADAMCLWESGGQIELGDTAKLLRKNTVAWWFLLSIFEHPCHQTLLKEQVIQVRWKCLPQ